MARQGFVTEEKRGDRRYYKLRFRSGGKQIVRYVGDAERAAAVAQELSTVQSELKSMRELKAITKIANRALRESKMVLEPLLKASGLVFHGFAIRRPRQRSSDVSKKSNSDP